MFLFNWLIKIFTPTDHLAPIKALMPELKELDRGLRWCWEHGNPLHRIVEFFDIVSKWHDREFNQVYDALEKGGPKYAHIVENLKVLCTHFANAGRCPYGWNRTEPGETVTPEKVFLGDIFGLFTKPVSYWLTLPVELRESELTHPAAPGKSPRQLVETQAYDFMEPHVRGIRETIAALDRALQPTDERATARPTPAMA